MPQCNGFIAFFMNVHQLSLNTNIKIEVAEGEVLFFT